MSDVWKVIAFGLWPLTVAAIAYLFWSMRSVIYRGKSSEDLEHMMYRMTEEFRYRTERQFEETRSIVPRMMESSLEDLRQQLGQVVEKALSRQLTPVGVLGPGPRSSPDHSSEGQLIRELSHSLNTPLSQIEASTLTLESEARRTMPDLANRLETIRAGVDICKSILTSFRELILSTQASTTWAPQSLQDAAMAASSV